MVEINNQRKAFLRYYAGVVGELITDVRKPEIMVMTSLWKAGELFWSPITLANFHHAKPKTQINRVPDATSFFPVGGCHRKQLGLKDCSARKVRTLWHCSN